jgi:hypothetical protein
MDAKSSKQANNILRYGGKMKKTIFLIILFFLCAQIASAVDEIIDGDEFVQGSECVGLLCPNSSNFMSDLGFTVLWVRDSRPQIFIHDEETNDADFAILVDSSEFGIYNEDTDTRLLSIDEKGIMQAAFDDSTDVGDGLTVLFEMSVDNQETTLVSDAGFSLENVKEGFKWAFRTSEPGQGFAATKLGTGGAEFAIENTTTDFRDVSLQLGNGASCDSSGQWLDASSRDYKENIQEITSIEAMKTLKGLQPVKYNFKRDPLKDLNVGFIAEDVPDLVATKDKKALSPLEIVAVLTKVVQEQQGLILSQKKAFNEQKVTIAKLTERISNLEER